MPPLIRALTLPSAAPQWQAEIRNMNVFKAPPFIQEFVHQQLVRAQAKPRPWTAAMRPPSGHAPPARAQSAAPAVQGQGTQAYARAVSASFGRHGGTRSPKSGQSVSAAVQTDPAPEPAVGAEATAVGSGGGAAVASVGLGGGGMEVKLRLYTKEAGSEDMMVTELQLVSPSKGLTPKTVAEGPPLGRVAKARGGGGGETGETEGLRQRGPDGEAVGTAGDGRERTPEAVDEFEAAAQALDKALAAAQRTAVAEAAGQCPLSCQTRARPHAPGGQWARVRRSGPP